MSAILIVDDNEANRYLLRAMLTASNHRVLEAANGAEALELARRTRPDLIIADILMPQMDGFALCRECKRDEQLRDVPFVFYTATYTDPRDEQLALQLGAARFIIKPIENEEFIAIVREVLQAHEAGQLIAPQPPLEEEMVYYRLYNQALIRKLEDKMLELARLNRALVESEAYFRALIENASDIITVLDSAEIIRYVSPSIERVLGYQPSELVGRNAFELVHPDDLPQAAGAFARVFPTPGVVSPTIEIRYRRKDGAWRTLEAIGRSLVAESGQLVGVVNSRDITVRKRRERELEAIAAVSAALRAAESRAEMLPLVLDHLTDLLKADGAAIATHHPASGVTTIELARGDWSAWTGIRLQPGEGIGGNVIATGQPYVTDDARNDPQITHLDLLGDLRAVACVPLSARGQTIGAVWVGRQDAFAAEEVRLLTAIGDMAANAIHRAALHEQTERQVERLVALRTIDSAISSSFDLHVILSVLLDQTLSRLGVDAAAVLLLNPHGLTLEYADGRGFRSDAIKRSRMRLGEGHAGRAALERHIVSIPDLAVTFGKFTRDALLAEEEFVTYFGVPLTVKGQVKGVLEIFHRARLDPDSEWLHFLETLAGQAAIAIDNVQLFDGLQRSNAELTLAYDTTLNGWVRALDLRDKETEGHTLRVTEMTLRLARAAGMGEAELVHVRRGALLHDIGKIGVSDTILLKPGALTTAEWAIIRQHPQYAYDMLAPAAFLRPALDIPYCHHEKWDGTGYPRGLKGEQIPLAARLFAVVDVWDALTSDRPYRKAWTHAEALNYIREQANKHFDPQVVDLFLKVLFDI